MQVPNLTPRLTAFSKQSRIETHRSGDLYHLIASNNEFTRPAEEWNHSQIVRHSNRVEHGMNGNRSVSFEIGSKDWNKLVSGGQYAEWPEYRNTKKSRIIFQDQGDQISFRNLNLRELK